LYLADLNGTLIAALLLLYFNRTVEYYTPVVRMGYRTLQPLSLLIFTAMKDALRRGFIYWNWGGTWLTQDGVYRFKSRWNTRDYPYYYYTTIYRNSILKLTKQKLLEEYPYFYVLLFPKQEELGQ
jgi:lipid II:glycine glycyltransferase (peptidoglycan interpeptide bridge formation enzyme)